MFELFDTFSNITIGLTITTGVISFFLYPFVDKRLKLLCLYFMMAGIIEIYIFSLPKGKNNLYLYHIYTFFEFLLLVKTFHFVFYKKKVQFNMNIILYPVLIMFMLNSLFVQKIDSYNSYSNILASLIILAFCVFYFYLILDGTKGNIKTESAIKWIITAVFLYHITMIIFNLFSNFLIEYSESNSYIEIWFFRVLILLGLRLIFLFQISRMSIFKFKQIVKHD